MEVAAKVFSRERGLGTDMDEDYSVLIYTDITDGAEENMADMSLDV
jgi:hypothetical protein